MLKPRSPQKENMGKPQERDNFQTPNYATDIVAQFIPASISYIWECAAGENKISDRLKTHGYQTYSTDIKFGYNFLLDAIPETLTYFRNKLAIITNPPYSLKRKFFEKCLEYDLPFGLLISGDYSLWTIDAVRKYNCQKIVPDHRINYITPTGLSEATGHSSYFHSYWLTRYFSLGQTETFIELTKEMRKNI